MRVITNFIKKPNFEFEKNYENEYITECKNGQGRIINAKDFYEGRETELFLSNKCIGKGKIYSYSKYSGMDMNGNEFTHESGTRKKGYFMEGNWNYNNEVEWYIEELKLEEGFELLSHTTQKGIGIFRLNLKK